MSETKLKVLFQKTKKQTKKVISSSQSVRRIDKPLPHSHRFLAQREQSPAPAQHGAGTRTRHVQRTPYQDQHTESALQGELQALLVHTGGASLLNPQRFNRYGSKDVCDRVSRHHARPMSELRTARAERILGLSYHTVFVHECAQAAYLSPVYVRSAHDHGQF